MTRFITEVRGRTKWKTYEELVRLAENRFMPAIDPEPPCKKAAKKMMTRDDEAEEWVLKIRLSKS